MEDAIHRAYWTPADDQTLRHYWSSGYTSTSIAKIIGRTRGSVIGRVWRLRLERRVYAVRKGPEPLAPIVHRDPCPNCGTRGDLGCKHQRLAA